MNLKYIYKIIDNEELSRAKFKGFYSGSYKDLEDGFIHFSEEEQVKSTLQKHFRNKENLKLLKVETFKLDHLVWEQASDGNFFPHLYSPLDLSTVVDEYQIILDDEGKYKLPDSF